MEDGTLFVTVYGKLEDRDNCRGSFLLIKKTKYDFDRKNYQYWQSMDKYSNFFLNNQKIYYLVTTLVKKTHFILMR